MVWRSRWLTRLWSAQCCLVAGGARCRVSSSPPQPTLPTSQHGLHSSAKPGLPAWGHRHNTPPAYPPRHKRQEMNQAIIPYRLDTLGDWSSQQRPCRGGCRKSFPAEDHTVCPYWPQRHHTEPCHGHHTQFRYVPCNTILLCNQLLSTLCKCKLSL